MGEGTQEDARMKVKMLNNGLIYDLDDMNKRYYPDDKGVWNAPVLLEDIEAYIKHSDEGAVILKRVVE